jgi:hypothetical protein
MIGPENLFRSQWRVLGRSEKISVLLGLVGGAYGATIGFLVAGSGVANVGLSSLLDFVPFLLFLFPLVSLVCAFWLLRFPVSNENRAMLGFISLVGSIAPTIFLILTILALIFPHRDTPTGL